MKAYVTTTGTIFGLIVVAHILRVLDEGPNLEVAIAEPKPAGY